MTKEPAMESAEELAEIILGQVWTSQESREWHKERTIKILTRYADAKLEEAAKIAALKKKEMNGIYGDPFVEGKYAMADILEREIKALKSKEPS